MPSSNAFSSTAPTRLTADMENCLHAQQWERLHDLVELIPASSEASVMALEAEMAAATGVRLLSPALSEPR